MSLEAMKEAHSWAYFEIGFKWVKDGERLNHPDKWRVCELKKDEGHIVFHGDCEDIALSVLDKILSMGVSREGFGFIRCATEECPDDRDFDHAILGFNDGENWHFSDNRYKDFGIVTRHDLMGYSLFDFVTLDNLKGVGKPKLFA